MAKLKVTMIDVGWGDSILIESQVSRNRTHYALIDSNDTQTLRSSFIFLKRHFEKAKISLPGDKPVFDFILLTHWHSDHSQGLKGIMKEFGTRNFWYPRSNERGANTDLLRYANRSSNVQMHQAVDSDHILQNLGRAQMRILWPAPGVISRRTENENSVVLQLSLGSHSFLLTGDSEKDAWNQISGQIPANTRFFKVPHHGSENGTFDGSRSTWLNDCPPQAWLGISSHVRPFDHPDSRVIRLFKRGRRRFLRTDESYHLIFETDGRRFSPRYSR